MKPGQGCNSEVPISTGRTSGLPTSILEINPYWPDYPWESCGNSNCGAAGIPDAGYDVACGSFAGVRYVRDPVPYPGTGGRFYNRLWKTCDSGAYQTRGVAPLSDLGVCPGTPTPLDARSVFDNFPSHLAQCDRYDRWAPWFDDLANHCDSGKVGLFLWGLQTTKYVPGCDVPWGSSGYEYTAASLDPQKSDDLIKFPDGNNVYELWFYLYLDKSSLYSFYRNQFAHKWGAGVPHGAQPLPTMNPPNNQPCD